MILVDTSVWIDHLHQAEPMLGSLHQDADGCGYPMSIGELALGTLRNRTVVLGLRAGLTASRWPAIARCSCWWRLAHCADEVSVSSTRICWPVCC